MGNWFITKPGTKKETIALRIIEAKSYLTRRYLMYEYVTYGTSEAKIDLDSHKGLF